MAVFVVFVVDSLLQVNQPQSNHKALMNDSKMQGCPCSALACFYTQHKFSLEIASPFSANEVKDRR